MPLHAPQRKTAGNSRPFAPCSVIRVDKDKEVKSFEVNVILEGNDTVVKGGWNPPEKYTSDFLICFQNGNKAIREAVFRKQLDKPSMIEKLEYSRRYWSAHGIDDWGIIVEKGQGEN